MIYACTTFGFVLGVFPWGIPPLQSAWSLSCDHGLNYASLCENNNDNVVSVSFIFPYPPEDKTTTTTKMVRFSEDPDILRDLVHLDEDPLACVRRSAWGMLYANGAGIVSKSAEGLAKMMTVNVTVFEAAGLTVSEKKTETMLLRTLN